MLLASTSGDMSIVTLVRDLPKSWVIHRDGRELRIRKSDPKRRVFEKSSEAMAWAGGDPVVVASYAEEERQREADLAKLEAAGV